MSTRYLLVQLLVFAMGLIALNGAIGRLSKNAVPRQLLRRPQLAAPATDVYLGNSLMAAALDEDAIRSVNPSTVPLNMGLGSTSVVEHLILYQAAAKSHPIRRVYYGFFDDQLTAVPSGTWNDLVGNRAMAYYAGPDTAAKFYAAGDAWLSLQIRTVGWLPMFTERQTIWSKVERVRRILGSRGLPADRTNRFGRADDFAQLEASDAESFARDRASDAGVGVPLTPAIAELLRSVRESGAQPVLVLMPMPRSHRSRFYSSNGWAEYSRWIHELARRAGATVLDASDWVDDKGFADPLHLDSNGAADFSKRLAVQPLSAPREP